MLISDWSSDVCSSDLGVHRIVAARHPQPDVVTITGEMDGEAAAVGARLEIAAAYRCCVRKAEAQDLAAREQRRGFWIVGVDDRDPRLVREIRSEEHTSELQSLMRISYAVFCLKKKKRLTRKRTYIN